MSSWLCDLDSQDRAAFEKRLHWVRLVERLAEAGKLEADAESLAGHDLMPRNDYVRAASLLRGTPLGSAPELQQLQVA